MIIHNLPMDEYHADSAISNSKVKVFLDQGPAMFARRYVAKDLPGDDTPAMAFGRAFDDLLFLPRAEFDARYVTKPDGMSFVTKEGKAWREGNAGKEVITWNDWEVMQAMEFAISDNPIARRLLARGSAQVSIRAEMPELGIVAQSRPDWLCLEACDGLTEGAYILDLKTCADLNDFDKNAIAFGYHRQLALGQALLFREGGSIIAEAFLLAVEKSQAPRCRVRKMPEVALAAGWEVFRGAAIQIGTRLMSGDWSDRQTEIETVQLASWSEKQLQAEAAN